jgi:ribonuclease D
VTRVSGGLRPPILVDTPDTFLAMLEALVGEPSLALDTESDSLYRYFYKVCLVQVSTASTDYLLDPLRLPDISGLNDLLADPSIEKVIHAAENDVVVLKRDFGFRFAHLFDTMVAARILGLPRVSLAALLEENFAVKLDKRAQLTDWGRRPLTTEQLSYARLDTHYLMPLRDLLAKELLARRRWREASETFAALPDLVPVDRPFDPEGFWRNREARSLSPQELAVLRELYLWRDGQARALDLPPFKVVDDRVLVQLSRNQPRELRNLGLSPWQARRFGADVLEAIARGQTAVAPTFPARSHSNGHRPDPAALERFDRLRAWRTERAAERGVASDVVLTNEVLMAVARAAPASLAELADLGVLGAFKLEEYGEELVRAMKA